MCQMCQICGKGKIFRAQIRETFKIHRRWHIFFKQEKPPKTKDFPKVFNRFPIRTSRFSTGFQHLWKRMWKSVSERVEKHFSAPFARKIARANRSESHALPRIVEDAFPDRTHGNRTVPGYEKDKPSGGFFHKFRNMFHN